MSVIDYADRKYDLCILQPSQPTGGLSVQTIINTPGGTICSGLHALIQRFVIELFTEKGSFRFAPQRGCSFLSALRSGVLRTEANVLLHFNLAAVNIYTNLKQQEARQAVLPDEAYAGVALDGIVIEDTTLRLTLTVFSEAGTTATVILPLNYLPAPLV